jgi:hypothetical protein
VFRNAFHYHESSKKQDEDRIDDIKDSIITGNDMDKLDFKDDVLVDKLTKSFLTRYCLEKESILKSSSNHVIQTKVMSHCIQQATESTITCHSAEVPNKDQEYVLVCDYAHNMHLPYYVGEKPEEIYYVSPLAINLFGMVYFSATPNATR